jgi:hypothetical protein
MAAGALPVGQQPASSGCEQLDSSCHAYWCYVLFDRDYLVAAGIIDGLKKTRGAMSKELKEEQECAEKVKPGQKHDMLQEWASRCGKETSCCFMQCFDCCMSAQQARNSCRSMKNSTHRSNHHHHSCSVVLSRALWHAGAGVGAGGQGCAVG